MTTWKGSITVLLVDDSSEVRTLVRTALRVRGGFEVVGEAADGARAVELAGSLQPAMVVLDLGLPDLADREVLTRIRLRSPLSKIAVFTGTPAEATGVERGADAFVHKDAEIGFLVELLEKLGAPGGREAETQLLAAPSSVAAARRFVRRVLASWGDDEATALEAAILVVVSELVTNAFAHARSPCRLRVCLRPSGVRVEVHDEGPGTPDPRQASELSESGRGLYLVAALSAAWGTDPSPAAGKVVWAELAWSARAGG